MTDTDFVYYTITTKGHVTYKNHKDMNERCKSVNS